MFALIHGLLVPWLLKSPLISVLKEIVLRSAMWLVLRVVIRHLFRRVELK